MSKAPSGDPIEFDRSQIRQPPKKSSSPVLKIVLAVFGCGFLVFACCAGWFGYTIYQGVQQGLEQARRDQADPSRNLAKAASGEAGFKAANSQISVKSGASAKGNSEAAVKLAAEFSNDIRTLREAFFTQRKKKPLFSLSDGEFLTYCRLDDQACVFLVHIPDLRKFSKDAKADLADLAWTTAQTVVRSNLETPPPQLAVGVRGVMFYDRTMAGKLQTGEQPGDGIESRKSGTGSESLLFTFFKSDVVPEGAGADDFSVTDEMSEDEATEEEMPEGDTNADSTENGPQ
jgi:hypothetical protein